jgi:hypothetical protein
MPVWAVGWMEIVREMTANVWRDDVRPVTWSMTTVAVQWLRSVFSA